MEKRFVYVIGEDIPEDAFRNEDDLETIAYLMAQHDSSDFAIPATWEFIHDGRLVMIRRYSADMETVEAPVAKFVFNDGTPQEAIDLFMEHAEELLAKMDLTAVGFFGVEPVGEMPVDEPSGDDGDG